MVIRNEEEMIALGEGLARVLNVPTTVELIGDVGVGKTTFVKGIAKGLGVKDEVTSPSFVVNKRYCGQDGIVLSHYDFYRLEEPGLMAAELEETAGDDHTITVVEWAGTVESVLDDERVRVIISYNDDGSRSVGIDGVEL